MTSNHSFPSRSATSFDKPTPGVGGAPPNPPQSKGPKRIPLCFRSHKDMAALFKQKAECFDRRVNVRNESEYFLDESFQDNVAMW